jgi:hypothetical protein
VSITYRRSRSREPVSCSGGYETIWQPGETIFTALRRRPETKIRYQRPRSTNEGLVMLAFIISLFYRQSCKKHLTDMRKQHHLWA